VKAILLAALLIGPGAASATTLNDLITAHNSIQVGNAIFSAFGGGFSTIGGAGIDVTGVTDIDGNPGLRFSTTALSIRNGGGSRELIADAVFTIDLTDDLFLLRGLRQDFSVTLSGGPITAYDFTTATPPGSILALGGASNCVNGDLAGCPQILGATDVDFWRSHTTSLVIDRQIQLIAARGGTGVGSVTTWDVFFSEVSAPAAPGSVTPTPEPAPYLLLSSALFAVAALRQRL
jgi:hypothetical protein